MQFIINHSDILNIAQLILIATFAISINELIIKPLILNTFKGAK